jgi:hypothetical protein
LHRKQRCPTALLGASPRIYCFSNTRGFFPTNLMPELTELRSTVPLMWFAQPNSLRNIGPCLPAPLIGVRRSNPSATVGAPIARLFAFERQRWRATEQHRSATMSRSLSMVVVLAGLLVGCSSPQRVLVASSDVPFSKQFQMRQGDAYEFRLPDGKTVAVWCERPGFGMMLGEQTTKSGLKTAWGERAFRQPEPLMKQTGPNSYESAGWKSYILQGAVTTTGDRTSEYELFVGDLRFAIIEDLTATDALPVTIKITQK